jgi:hypothetical protein
MPEYAAKVKRYFHQAVKNRRGLEKEPETIRIFAKTSKKPTAF